MPREDQTRILQATLLTRAITMYGFSPQVAFSTQVRESNAQLYDFQRNLWKCAGSGSFKDSLLSSSTSPSVMPDPDRASSVFAFSSGCEEKDTGFSQRHAGMTGRIAPPGERAVVGSRFRRCAET